MNGNIDASRGAGDKPIDTTKNIGDISHTQAQETLGTTALIFLASNLFGRMAQIMNNNVMRYAKLQEVDAKDVLYKQDHMTKTPDMPKEPHLSDFYQYKTKHKRKKEYNKAMDEYDKKIKTYERKERKVTQDRSEESEKIQNIKGKMEAYGESMKNIRTNITTVSSVIKTLFSSVAKASTKIFTR